MRNLLLASTNPGKLRELREMMADLPVTVRSLIDVRLQQMEVEETGDTFEANALLKARAYCTASGLPTLAEDSGIVVDALNGEPGVYSARYAPTDGERNAKLLKMLEGVPYERRTARYVCAMALVTPDQITVVTEGRAEGHVAPELRGTNGFGYDPLFLLDSGLTMAELLPVEKNAISHRGRALARMQPILRCLFT